MIRPDGSEGASIPLGTEGTVGRSSTHEALAGDPFLSPEHATFSATGSGYRVRDCDSHNGVFLRIGTEVDLQDGDQVRLGQELLVFRTMSALEPITPPSKDDTMTYGSPDGGSWGRLVLVNAPDQETRSFLLRDDSVTVGREIGDILFRDDGFVSGKHARFEKLEERVLLKDLGSSNGTYLRIRGEQELKHGDLVLMGQQLFRLMCD